MVPLLSSLVLGTQLRLSDGITGAVIVVGLTYFPVLALGPIVEQLVGKF